MTRKNLKLSRIIGLVAIALLLVVLGYLVWRGMSVPMGSPASTTVLSGAVASATLYGPPSSASFSPFFNGNYPRYLFENILASAGNPVSSSIKPIILTFQVFSDNFNPSGTIPEQSTQGIDFSNGNEVAASVSNNEGIQCAATVLSSQEGNTGMATSTNVFYIGNEWTMYTVEVQPSCALSPSYDSVQLAAPVNGVNYPILSATLPVPSSLSAVSTASSSPPPVPDPRVVVLDSPANDITVQRGQNINISWHTSGGTPSDTIDFFLFASSTYDQEDRTVSADQDTLTLPATSLPGAYTLSVTYSYITGYATTTYAPGFVPISNEATISKPITITITPVPQILSLASSSVKTTDNDNTVPADGACKAEVRVTVVDQFGYGISGQPISLQSTRPNDVITPEATTTDGYGILAFAIQSNQVGTSTLTASTNGTVIGATTISFLDPSVQPCISYNGDY